MKRKTQWIWIFTLFGAVTIGVLFYFRSLAILFLIAVVLSYLLHPLVNGFVLREVPVSIGILICYGMMLMILSFLFSVILPLIFRQFQGILASLPIYYEYVLSD